jgi:hypothetical protein
MLRSIEGYRVRRRARRHALDNATAMDHYAARVLGENRQRILHPDGAVNCGHVIVSAMRRYMSGRFHNACHRGRLAAQLQTQNGA